jgi:ABC-type nitrate/sulfonate/bicarbonate transport system substrate-binding protein
MAETEFDRNAAENLIKAVQEAYFDLRKQSPDRDEHWYLANVWLKRYGSGAEAKEKGEEWAQFTAYKETHEFAILDSPQSIRGLALLLVARERRPSNMKASFLRPLNRWAKPSKTAPF